MKINWLVNDVSYMDYKTQVAHWGWEPTDKRLGGTEESIVRWAQELVKRGHEVTIYRNYRDQSQPVEHKGVKYVSSKDYEGGADICINVKNSEVVPKEPTLYLTNETNADETDLSKYLGVIWPSHWAVDNIPVNNRTFILPHGYDETKIYPKEKTKKQVLYSASPDRGLDLLAQIWPSIVGQHPDAHLYVTYGGEINTPNTTCGEFSEEEMNELYNTSDIWVYPCTGGELFGMNAIKAQAARAIPVYFPTMALSETVQSGISCTSIREMYNHLNTLLNNEDKKAELRDAMSYLFLPNWETTTDRLLEIIEEVL